MKKLFVCTTALLLLLFLANPVYAYLDPGTGSMLVQAVIAAVAAASVSIGVFRRRIRSFFGRLFGRKKDE
ncbi:MAG: hypothetical protein KAU60_00360 [Desulfobacterales bacterium]|nr:hypothetical protein [Desulfobacterales bacterium]